MNGLSSNNHQEKSLGVRSCDSVPGAYRSICIRLSDVFCLLEVSERRCGDLLFGSWALTSACLTAFNTSPYLTSPHLHVLDPLFLLPAVCATDWQRSQQLAVCIKDFWAVQYLTFILLLIPSSLPLRLTYNPAPAATQPEYGSRRGDSPREFRQRHNGPTPRDFPWDCWKFRHTTLPQRSIQLMPCQAFRSGCGGGFIWLWTSSRQLYRASSNRYCCDGL